MFQLQRILEEDVLEGSVSRIEEQIGQTKSTLEEMLEKAQAAKEARKPSLLLFHTQNIP